MKKRNKLIVLLVFFLLKFSGSFAQIDTSFWFAAPWITPDHTFRDPVKIHISTFSAPTTTVRVRQPSAIAPNKYDTTIVIPANTNFDYTFWRDAACTTTNRAYDSLETFPGNTVVPYGLYISSTSNVTIVYDVITRAPTFYNPETFSMKGQNGLGLEFLCPFQTKWHNQNLGNLAGTPPGVDQPKQQINIVASKPNTTVWITPKTGVVGHPANVTYSVFLPSYGSAYTVENLVQNTNVPGNNLSGSIVVADKPIAVTVADDSVDGLTGCYDLMGDQIVPVDIIGTDYILNKGFMNAAEPDGAFIVGTVNFTQLTINDGVVTTTLINKGDTYHYHTLNPLTYVNASNPVYVLHATGVGGGCELGEALLPPLNCAGSNLVAFSRNTPQSFFLNLLCKNGSQSTFTLNNAAQTVTVPITPANFTLAPGTATLPGGPYYGCQLNLNSTATLPLGSYTVGNSTDVFALGVLDGGASTGGLFHYMSSFLRKTIVTTASIAPQCANGTNTVALTGTISGAANSGSWTTNGQGTVSPVYISNLGTVSTIYTLSAGEATSPTSLSITFTLTSIGCSPKSQTVSMTINPLPVLTAALSPTLMCKNNLVPVNCIGTVSNVVGGAGWTGGNGGSFGIPGPNTTYTPSPADLAANGVTLTLTSSGPLPGCSNTSTNVSIGFINPPVVNPGPSTVVCTNSQSFALNGSVAGATNTGVWNTTGSGLFFPGSASPSATYVLSVSDLTTSTLVFTLTSTNNGLCSGVSNTMQVNIIAKPVVTAPADFTVCANGGAISLNGSVSGAASTGAWTTPNGTGVFGQVPPANATYTMSQNDTINGNVSFVLNSTGGICPAETDTVKVAILKAPLVTVNSNTSICKNALINLNGNVAGYTNSGIWNSSGSGAFTPSNTALSGQYFPSPGDVVNGSVSFTLSSTNNQNCPPSRASFTAFFVPSPKAIFGLPPIRCQNTPVVFTDNSQANGTSNLSYNWNFGEGPGSVSTATNPIYTYTGAGSYVVTFTVTGTSSLAVSCPDTVSQRITIYTTPEANFNIQNACQGLGTIFKDSSIVSTGNITSWSWQFGDGVTSTVRNPVHTYSVTGSYYVVLQATSNYSCVSPPISKLVTVNPKPDANFGMTNNPTVAQEPVYFSDFSSPTGALAQWQWTFGDEKTDYVPNPQHIYENAGIYLVTLTVFDKNGCSDSTSRSIEVQLLPQVPTAFTPNGDNTNDLLFVKGGPFQSMKFRVYDNWGILIFETTDQKIGWDGKKDGVDQQVGPYVWTLEADMYNNRQVKINGDVTLLR